MINNTAEQPDKLNNTFLADASCVSGFITKIWNENKQEKISDYLHEHFKDYSMPHCYFQNKEGLLSYLSEMASRVSHHTRILEIRAFDDFVLCKIRINAVSLPGLDGMAAAHEIIDGYRLFQMQENKIIAHWDML